MSPLALPRRRALAVLAGAALSLSLAACSGGPAPAPTTAGGSPTGKALVIGSSGSTEGKVLAEVYAGALNASGVKASTGPDFGAREAYVKALEDGSVDVVPEYTGGLLLFLDPEAGQASAGDVAEALADRIPEGLAVLDRSKAEKKDVLVVTRLTAEKYSLTSIEDLAKVCSELVFGAPAAFAERDDGLPGLKAEYGCEPKRLARFTDHGGPVTLKALLTDQVQVADIYTTAPSIEDNDLVVLEDPKDNFIAQQVVPLVRTETVPEAARAVLNQVSSKLTTQDLMDLNRAVSGNQKQSPAAAAKAWLAEKGFAS
ncbi:ABC transporter substrate-binding protein [Sinomonas halotolerans]|uniref:ABC transporter substrate-binding protein n=1 Tax=Sinomonas halotolerans TaxID=1644133 RepID=A0ABU9X1N8_9MICC